MTAAASIGDLLAGVAAWSAWVPFSEAVQVAPREPGVYLARQGPEVLYVGMAGPRDRGGKAAPKGLRGRLPGTGATRPTAPRGWPRRGGVRAAPATRGLSDR